MDYSKDLIDNCKYLIDCQRIVVRGVIKQRIWIA